MANDFASAGYVPAGGARVFNKESVFGRRVEVSDDQKPDRYFTIDILTTEGYRHKDQSEAGSSAVPEDRPLLEREATELSVFERIRRAVSNLPCLRGGDA
ncbi:hypothetical protein [Endozoicomonas sp.]|uniref:hypothetical protein n=1 Tax=Endozoicomonas sp. TaxID=1892382 RepID=UPI003AF4A2EC